MDFFVIRVVNDQSPFTRPLADVFVGGGPFLLRFNFDFRTADWFFGSRPSWHILMIHLIWLGNNESVCLQEDMLKDVCKIEAILKSRVGLPEEEVGTG